MQGSSPFGTLLRKYRLAAGFSQEALAERARLSVNGISALERGYRRSPQRETLALLADALDLSVAQRKELEEIATAAVSDRGQVVMGTRRQSSQPSNLPLALSRFIGRGTEIAAVVALIAQHRWVTLFGSGGVGKTRLALEVAANLVEGLEDGVWLVELAPLTKGEYIPSAIASVLAMRVPSDGDAIENLAHALKDKKMLLVFDNCEHLVESAARAISSILHAAPKVRVLATTRQRFGVAGEMTYKVPSLFFPIKDSTVLTLGELQRCESVALFADRATAASDTFQLNDENAPIVAKICRRLDGIPLAIELAAARVKMLSLKQLHDWLDERFRILTVGNRNVLPRHQTMRALIDWSHELLDGREQVLFRRLATFVNSFTLESAVAVANCDAIDELDVFDVLASLVDKSLVLADPLGDTVRLRLLESTRAYAFEKLDAAGERERLASRHLGHLRDYFVGLWQERRQTARFADSMAALQVELEDVRSALDAGLSTTELTAGAELLASLDVTWQYLGLHAEGMARCEAYLAALAAEESRLRAQLLCSLSYFLADSGRKARAFELAAEAVQQARASGDMETLARALQRYGNNATLLNRPDDAERALAEAEVIPGPRAMRLTFLETRAILSMFRGDLENAARMFEQVRIEHRALRNALGERNAKINLADIEHMRGRTQHAIEIVCEILPSARASADRHILVNLLNNLAGYLIIVNDLSGAAKAAREAIEIGALREPDHAHVAIPIEHLALAAALRGDVPWAAKLEGYADAALKRHGFGREFTETKTFERLKAVLQQELSHGDLARLTAEGAALAPEAAVALALSRE